MFGLISLAVLSAFVWAYAGEEPFYGWGGTSDRLVYWLMFPFATAGWLAVMGLTVFQVIRRRLPPIALVIVPCAATLIWLMYQSLGTYLSDNGIRLPFYR